MKILLQNFYENIVGLIVRRFEKDYKRQYFRREVYITLL